MAWTVPTNKAAGNQISVSDMNTLVRDNMAEIRAHIDTLTAVHGLGTGILPVGAAAAKYMVQPAVSALQNPTVATVNFTWGVAFSTAPKVTHSVRWNSSSANAGAELSMSAPTTTGVTVYVNNPAGQCYIVLFAVGYKT